MIIKNDDAPFASPIIYYQRLPDGQEKHDVVVKTSSGPDHQYITFFGPTGRDIKNTNHHYTIVLLRSGRTFICLLQ
jgi:hypothetical protein